MKKPRKPKEGWADIANSRKFHYVRNSMSLCGRWLYLGPDLTQDDYTTSDDCRACTMRRQKELEKTK